MTYMTHLSGTTKMPGSGDHVAYVTLEDVSCAQSNKSNDGHRLTL